MNEIENIQKKPYFIQIARANGNKGSFCGHFVFLKGLLEPTFILFILTELENSLER